MQFSNWFAIGSGAALGAWLHWRLGILLNPVFPTIPLGTVAANLLAGLLIGISIEALARYSTLPPETRVFVVTGFLGGLSTFSTFSAEIVTLLRNREPGWALGAIALHVMGSVLFTILGILIVRFLLLPEGAP
jgi:fluoride exporter